MKFGADKIADVQAKWAELQAARNDNHADSAKEDGVIVALIRLGCSTVQIIAVLGNVGSSRVDRLRHKRDDEAPKVYKPAHAFNDATISFFKATVGAVPTEDGFPCPHRRPRKYVLEEGATWTKLYKHYEEAWKEYDRDHPLEQQNKESKVALMSYSTFTQYAHFFFPGLRLSKSKEDVCDACTRLNIILNDPQAGKEAHAAAQAELEMHTSAARDQRRVISQFAKVYAGKLCPGASLPSEILPDYLDGDEVSSAPADPASHTGDDMPSCSPLPVLVMTPMSWRSRLLSHAWRFQMMVS
eukprot:jgi/Mesvir1/7147/Mv02507-RA.1